MEQMTAFLAKRLLDPTDTPANVAEDVLEMMQRMDVSSKQNFLTLLLMQTLSAGKLEGMPAVED
jgi:hypothetical protein